MVDEVVDKAVAVEEMEDEYMDDADEVDEEVDEEPDDVEDWKVCKERNTMMEVFGIIYQGGDDVEPGKQSGWIKLESASGFRYIYKVRKVKKGMESIKQGDELVVNAKGPIRYNMYSTDSNVVHFDVFSGAYKGTNNDLCEWSPSCLNGAYLNKISLGSIDKSGEIVVVMGLYPHAMVAKVEVTLLGEYKSAPKVYGVVAASNSELDVAMCTSMLFLKKDCNLTPVGNDGVIPLSRSHVAVPFGSYLYIDISLHVDRNNREASIKFPSRKLGPHVGGNEFFKVKVEWDVFYDKDNPEDEGEDDSEEEE